MPVLIRQPPDYETGALPTELMRPVLNIIFLKFNFNIDNY